MTDPSFAVLGVTTLLTIVATVGVHALGTVWWISRLRLAIHRRAPSEHRTVLNFTNTLVRTALVLVVLHLVEVLLWAASLRLVAGEALANWEEAVYLSLTTFTTLGYGDITLPPPVRLLAGVESLNGVLLLGWSTALSFAAMQRMWDRGKVPFQESQSEGSSKPNSLSRR